MITIPIGAFAALIVVIVILALLLWSVKRRRRPRLDFRHDGGLRELLPSIVGLTHSTLVPGNKLALVQNGEYFDALFGELEAARKTIDLETFLCKSGDVTKRIADMLSKKAGEGVEVRVLFDASGGKKFGQKDMKRMREAGCKVRVYHPLRFGNLARMNNRDHRKIVVIDGRLAFAGGHCLVDTWLGQAEDKEHFRDISLRMEGPVVAQLQAAFSENWVEETGDVPAGEQFFPELEHAGDSKAHAVYTTPAGSPSAVELLHYLAIRAARERITIQNPYFLPDPAARLALVDAVKRGVEVRVMIPAVTATDAPIVQHASHHHFGTLLKGGVRIWEYQRTLLHQKVMTVDGCWSSIGSTNFDDRSFELNDEISVGVYDEHIARELEETFERDAQHATEVKLEEWKRRPLWHKVMDGAVYLFNEQL